MLRLLMAFIGMALIAQSCQTQTSGEQISSNGYKYEIFPSGSGDLVPDSSYAEFHAYIYKDGEELIQNTLTNPDIPSLLMERPFKEMKGSAPLREVLSKMTIGDSAAVYFPADSFPRKDPSLDSTEVVVYGLSLIGQKTMEEFNAEIEKKKAELLAKKERLMNSMPEIEARRDQIVADHKAGNIEWQETPEGLRYILHEEGEGAVPQNGQTVEAHYYGYLTDGTRFDDSFSRGQSFQFPLGQGRVIRGWDIAFAMLKPGAKATILVPSDLGYGERGSPPVIQPNSDLFFYVELLGAK